MKLDIEYPLHVGVARHCRPELQPPLLLQLETNETRWVGSDSAALVAEFLKRQVIEADGDFEL